MTRSTDFGVELEFERGLHGPDGRLGEEQSQHSAKWRQIRGLDRLGSGGRSVLRRSREQRAVLRGFRASKGSALPLPNSCPCARVECSELLAQLVSGSIKVLSSCERDQRVFLPTTTGSVRWKGVCQASELDFQSSPLHHRIHRTRNRSRLSPRSTAAMLTRVRQSFVKTRQRGSKSRSRRSCQLARSRTETVYLHSSFSRSQC